MTSSIPPRTGVGLLLGAVLTLNLAQSASGQTALFTEFDTVLGFFHPDNLVGTDTGAGQSAEFVEHLVSTSSAMQAAVANEIANLAISAAGTQYFFGRDRMVYASGNFGSFFVEPPWTTGAGNGSIGINTTHIDFQTLQGTDFDELYDLYDDQGNKVWETDYNLRGQLTTLSMTFGVTDKLDVGFIIPMVHLEGDGSAGINLFGTEVPIADFEESYTNTADMLLRLKYELLEVEDLDNLFTWSVGFDFKADNGDEEKLLGTGDLGYRFRTLVGKRYGRVYPVMELAYYFAGVDVPSRLTGRSPTGEVVTFDTGLEDDDFNAFEIRAALPITVFEERWTLGVEWMLSHSKFATTNDVAVSSRFRVNDQLFMQGGVRFPVDDQGLRTDFMPTLGGEFRF